jgi:hypothetical protein
MLLPPTWRRIKRLHADGYKGELLRLSEESLGREPIPEWRTGSKARDG